MYQKNKKTNNMSENFEGFQIKYKDFDKWRVFKGKLKLKRILWWLTPQLLENIEIDTSPNQFSKIEIRLFKFVKTAYSDEVFEKIKSGELVVWSNGQRKYDENFRNYRVHPMTEVRVIPKDDLVDSIPPGTDIYDILADPEPSIAFNLYR